MKRNSKKWQSKKSKDKSSSKPQSSPEDKNKPLLNIKWNALDGLISIVFLIVLLVGIYFGTSKLISVLNIRNVIDLNIGSIDSFTFFTLPFF